MPGGGGSDPLGGREEAPMVNSASHGKGLEGVRSEASVLSWEELLSEQKAAATSALAFLDRLSAGPEAPAGEGVPGRSGVSLRSRDERLGFLPKIDLVRTNNVALIDG